MTKEEKVQEILKRLYKIWPNPKSELNHSNPLELLFAVILSAQTTDKTVNQVTPALFEKYKTVDDYANADVSDIEKLINKVNFYKAKAGYIKKSAQMIREKFHSEVPQTVEELTQLPGVARKTANVVLGDAFNKREGIAVDTHVRRLSYCLGLTDNKDPVKIEQDLMKIVPKEKWTDFSHLLVLFGRYYCPAKMNCCDCPPLSDLC